MKSSDPNPLVSIVLPCRNEQGYIQACLQSALHQDPPEAGFEILVADGMSTDGTREYLQQIATQYPQIRILDNPGRIVSTGLNTAIRAARGEIIVRMDAHTIYAPDYVQQCLAVMSETEADNVGGPMQTTAETFMERAIRAVFHSAFAVGGARSHQAGYEGYVDTVIYGCWKKSVFERIGYFDEELVRNQDDEHNLRLTRAGGKIYQSTRIRSWYHVRGSLTALFRQYMQYGYWKVLVIRKHQAPASFRHLAPGSFVGCLCAEKALGVNRLHSCTDCTAALRRRTRSAVQATTCPYSRQIVGKPEKSHATSQPRLRVVASVQATFRSRNRRRQNGLNCLTPWS